MGRAVLLACLPWLALLVALFVCVYLLVRLSGSRVRLSRLRNIHRDERGSVQSLSFVLTLPLLVMIILFIVQVSQLMIGTIVVHYAAYAAARSAVVWIPAHLSELERANCISTYYVDPMADDQFLPIFDPTDENYGPAEGGVTYVIEPGSPKYEKITSAAVMACMPISPSRNVGLEMPPGGVTTVEIIKEAYRRMVPDSQANAMIPSRLANKLAYAMHSTAVEIRFFHKNSEPPLVPHFRSPDLGEFYIDHQLGWQDQITVTVRHNLALLPGPGRLLAKPVRRPGGPLDEVSQGIRRIGKVYVYPLEASATLGNEGERPEIPYLHDVY